MASVLLWRKLIKHRFSYDFRWASLVIEKVCAVGLVRNTLRRSLEHFVVILRGIRLAMRYLEVIGAWLLDSRWIEAGMVAMSSVTDVHIKLQYSLPPSLLMHYIVNCDSSISPNIDDWCEGQWWVPRFYSGSAYWRRNLWYWCTYDISMKAISLVEDATTELATWGFGMDQISFARWPLEYVHARPVFVNVIPMLYWSSVMTVSVFRRQQIRSHKSQ